MKIFDTDGDEIEIVKAAKPGNVLIQITQDSGVEETSQACVSLNSEQVQVLISELQGLII